jgi:hypothetical protein
MIRGGVPRGGAYGLDSAAGAQREKMNDEAYRLGAEWLAGFLDHYWQDVELDDRAVETMERWRVTPMDLRHVARNPSKIFVDKLEQGGRCIVEGLDLDGRTIELEAKFTSQEMSCFIRKVTVVEMGSP